MRFTTALGMAAAASFAPASALAQEEPSPGQTAAADDLSQIIVYGRSERRIGIAGAASEGGVSGADLEIRPLLRPAELLEATPGLIATQHSGGGKANQYFLRGFNLDHGTDFSVQIDGMPMNFRTHGHGQGYLDVNGLIPEAVARVDYRKGPYRAESGDFSFVGSSEVTTHDTLAPFVVGELGGYGYRRFVAGGSAKVAAGDLLLVTQAKFYDGPWDLPEDFSGYSALLKYSAPLGLGKFEVSLNLFDAGWAPTEQLPQRAVGTLVEDEYGSLDRTLRGTTQRQILTANYLDDDWRINFWGQHYDWSLLSNFTYFLEDPVNGDQLRQYEKLLGWGSRIERRIVIDPELELKIGTELRDDALDPVGLDHTIAGQFDFVRTAFDVRETSAGLYAEAIWRPTDRLMVIGGLRNDWYRFRTTDLGGALGWSGKVNDTVSGARLGANFELAPGLAIYANYGEGFHSNDARGVTNPADPAPGLVKGDMEEAGFRLEREGLIFTGVYWWSSIASELIYVGDSGAVEPSDPGVRRGYEFTAFYKPNSWLAVDAVWAGSRARYAGLPDGENYVPGALESAGELGISAIFPQANGAVRFRYLGPHPLIEDNSQRGEHTLLVNLRLAWTPGATRGFEVYGELLNALATNAHDVDYYYETRFPGEPDGGVLDLNSRVVEPRQFRFGIRKEF